MEWGRFKSAIFDQYLGRLYLKYGARYSYGTLNRNSYAIYRMALF